MARLSFSDGLTVGALILAGEKALSATSSSARLDSELLIGHVLKYDRLQLILRRDQICTGQTAAEFGALIERRQQGEPLAYIIGAREFWGLSFAVDASVLVPRPESELIIEEALKFFADSQSAKILDLGVGSGCLSISLVVELQRRGVQIDCLGVDISEAALITARRNAERHGVLDRIRYIQGDWFDTVESVDGQYDLILANPPYIDPAESVPVELSFEPRQALFAEQKGLRDIKIIIQGAVKRLRPSGMLLLEVGAGKRADMRELLEHDGICAASGSGSSESHCHYSFLGDDSEFDRFTVVKIVVAR